jgi:hypothetical protein
MTGTFGVIPFAGSSQEYRDRKWTSHELRSAQARALEEESKEYILAIKVQDYCS